MGKLEFNKVEKEDIKKLKEIYQYYIDNSTATFHIGAISDEDMENILFSDDQLYESFKINESDNVLGYVLLSPYKKREAYRRSAEVTLYLADDAIGKGIGTKAMKFIEEVAINKGLKTLLSVICAENTGSIKLFEKMGYEKCAHLKGVGEKFGRVLDIVMYQKEI